MKTNSNILVKNNSYIFNKIYYLNRNYSCNYKSYSTSSSQNENLIGEKEVISLFLKDIKINL